MLLYRTVFREVKKKIMGPVIKTTLKGLNACAAKKTCTISTCALTQNGIIKDPIQLPVAQVSETFCLVLERIKPMLFCKPYNMDHTGQASINQRNTW